ncbi:MAG: TetR family transcriptional regulator C-terminal domain-containing protein [Dongiaceae bacterium]
MIDATISTIGRVGYSGTTLNHVAGAAGLSPGIVNFYFKSKDQLLAATLAQLAEEHESLWLAKIAAAGGSPEGGLDAMIEADFDPSICTADKVVVWFAFWAEAQSRPLYRSVVSELEERYFQQTHAFCAELVEKGGYVGIDPADVARGLNAISDGLWADLLILPETFDLPAAKRICRTFLGAVFPRHFPRAGGPANDTERVRGLAVAPPGSPQSAAHRARLSAALQRRLFPASALQPTDLAQQVGVDLPMLLDWIDGRDEPSSSQLGRLIAALDPVFVLDLYGDEVDSMRRRFEAALAAAREAEVRARAALDVLRGTSR